MYVDFSFSFFRLLKNKLKRLILTTVGGSSKVNILQSLYCIGVFYTKLPKQQLCLESWLKSLSHCIWRLLLAVIALSTFVCALTLDGLKLITHLLLSPLWYQIQSVCWTLRASFHLCPCLVRCIQFLWPNFFLSLSNLYLSRKFSLPSYLFCIKNSFHFFPVSVIFLVVVCFPRNRVGDMVEIN